MTFDCVTWVITMKKNDHYFPMMEWIKDDKEACGWRRVSYDGNEAFAGEPTDGVAFIAEDADIEAGPES